EDSEKLLRLGLLRERGKPAEVAEDGGDLPSVAAEELFALLAGDQRGHLRREEPAQLVALALDRPIEPREAIEVLELEVVEPLLRQRSVHAGAQDRGIKRLGQVVGGAQ